MQGTDAGLGIRAVSSLGPGWRRICVDSAGGIGPKRLEAQGRSQGRLSCPAQTEDQDVLCAGDELAHTQLWQLEVEMTLWRLYTR